MLDGYSEDRDQPCGAGYPLRVKPASQRALIWVLSIAAILAPSAGLAYLGAVSYRDDRGAVAERLDDQRGRAQQVATEVERRVHAAVDAVAIAQRTGELDASLGALVAAGGLTAEPFVVEAGGAIVWPPRAALGGVDAGADVRPASCTVRGLESCLRQLRAEERRARQLDDARRAELAACPEGTCRPGEPLDAARRLYGQLARFDDTGIAAGLGLARMSRGSGDAARATRELTELATRFAGRIERGVPVEVLARLARAELAGDPEELLALYADLVARQLAAPAAALAAIGARIDRALGAHALEPAARARRAALDAALAQARARQAAAAALAPDLADVVREAGATVRSRPALREPHRTLVFRRDGERVVGVVVDVGRLAAVADLAAVAPIAVAARAQIVPVGTTPAPELRTLVTAPLGPSLPHLTLANVHDRALPDPLDDVIHSRSRRHLLLTTGLAALLAVGLLATIRAAGRERELARLQSHFVSTVSHELKTPLTSIRMFAEMLREGVAGEDVERQSRYHEIIVKESQRLGLLIGNLLDYAQIERGTRRYSQRPEPVGEVAAEAVDTFVRLQDPAAGNTVTLTVSPQATMIAAVVDREVLIGAVLNLLSNAAKYGGAARPIEVEVTRVGDEARVAVTDHGPGIPAVEQARIFREFYRAPGAYSSGAPGTGLGLALVRRHVEAQGGAVAVVSDEGRGATFTISLPLAARGPA